jgi:hypothetical protein
VEKQEFIEFVKDSTRRIFAEQGEIFRCLLVLDKDGRFCPVEFAGLDVAQLDREEQAALFASAIAQFRMECQLVAHVSEAWTVRLEEGEPLPDGPIRDEPDKEEVLIISFCGRDDEDSAIAVCPILREGDTATLGDWIEESGSDNVSGRLFPEPQAPPEWN